MTDDLGALLDLPGRSVPDTAAFRGLIALNPVAVHFRYEALADEMEPLDRDSLVAELRRLGERVQGAV